MIHEDLSGAASDLNAAGTVAGSQRTAVDCDHPRTVASQNPQPGTQAAIEVNLVLGHHPSRPPPAGEISMTDDANAVRADHLNMGPQRGHLREHAGLQHPPRHYRRHPRTAAAACSTAAEQPDMSGH
jgi:hypothetical protein